MADVTMSMTVMEAQQVEAALADRINTLANMTVPAGTTEAGMVASGLDYTSRAYHHLVLALYPSSVAETVALWAMPESEARLMDGNR